MNNKEHRSVLQLRCMLGWIAGAVALAAIVVAGVNLDFIRKTDTYLASLHQNVAATLQTMHDATSSLSL